MPKWTFARGVVVLTLVAVITTLTGCAISPQRADSAQTTGSVTPTAPVPDVMVSWFGGAASLQQLVSADLIIEGTVTGKKTRQVLDTTATNAELAERQARGESTSRLITDWEVTIDKVLKGQVDSRTVTIGWLESSQVGDRAILFLREIFSDQAPSQTKYEIIAPEGQFRIQKDNKLFTYSLEDTSWVTDKYRGKDKSVLEKDVRDLVTKLKPTKEETLQKVLLNGDVVIEGTIQGARGVHFKNGLEKPQEWIDQMLAEGKMPGLVLTDYAVTVNKVIFDKRGYYPKYFPDWKPLEPGQTVIVTRQGGTYRGVTKIEEAGPAFEVGSREILFLSGFPLVNYGLPEDGQERYSTDSRMGRFLLGSDGKLTAFTTKGLGGFYGGQNVSQLEQDIAQLVKEHSFGQPVPAPTRQ